MSENPSPRSIRCYHWNITDSTAYTHLEMCLNIVRRMASSTLQILVTIISLHFRMHWTSQSQNQVYVIFVRAWHFHKIKFKMAPRVPIHKNSILPYIQVWWLIWKIFASWLRAFAKENLYVYSQTNWMRGRTYRLWWRPRTPSHHGHRRCYSEASPERLNLPWAATVCGQLGYRAW